MEEEPQIHPSEVDLTPIAAEELVAEEEPVILTLKTILMSKPKYPDV